MRIINLLGQPFIVDRPPGMCPWGEAECDDGCKPFEGCKLERHECATPDLGHAGGRSGVDGYYETALLEDQDP